MLGGPFLACHPGKYADLLSQKIQQQQVDVWLLNTGWIGGAYGVGQRIPLRHTRAIVDAIHDGSFADVAFVTDPVFGLAVPVHCPGVPSEVLQPRQYWDNRTNMIKQPLGLSAFFNKILLVMPMALLKRSRRQVRLKPSICLALQVLAIQVGGGAAIAAVVCRRPRLNWRGCYRPHAGVR